MKEYTKDSVYAEWMENTPNVFVSKVYKSFSLPKNGAGIYILNSYKFFFFPRFYFSKSSDRIEAGVNFAGWICEFMWNKAFKVNDKHN